MESTTPHTEPEAPALTHEDQAAIAASRTTVLILITAVAFFVIGYGVAYLSFTATKDVLVADFQATVEEAVASALAEADLAVAQQPDQELQPPAIQDISIDDDPVFGPDDAAITIVEFSDFRCPYCARFSAQTLDPLFDLYEGQIRLVYRDFPVVGGEQAAMASECAHDQDAFWEYHDLLFENQSALTGTETLVDLARQLDIDLEAFQSCLEDQTYSDEVAADFQDGVSYGVRGTPAFFVNGRMISGAQPLAAFQTVIDEILAEQAAAG